MNEARMDLPNDMSENGEVFVQQVVLRHARRGARIVVFDVGANIGNWSRSFIAQTPRKELSLEIHAFEPCRETYALLVKALAPYDSRIESRIRVLTIPKACSSSSGTAELQVVGAGEGRNSLTLAAGTDICRVEAVQLTSIDEYCEGCGLDHLDFVKIDAEGHDFEVVRGAARMLGRQAIEVLQFEYNHRWIFGRSFLRDAFEFLHPRGYLIGKITPKGVEFYRFWHAELETFQEGNYLVCRPELASQFNIIAPSWLEKLVPSCQR